MNASGRTPLLIGAILIAVGVVAFAGNWFEVSDGFIAVAVAAVLLVAYAITRGYVFLAIGLIALGSGIGTAVQDYGYDEKGALVAILSGAGFLAVYLVDVLTGTTHRWWPIVPGAILVVLGGVSLADGTPAEQWIERLWPIALVIAGVVIVLAARRPRPRPAGMVAEAKPAGH